MRFTCSFSFSILALLPTLPAQTVTTAASIRDNTIYSESGSLSNGAVEVLLCGTTGAGNLRRGLIEFDLPPVIPSTAVVVSARIDMKVDRANGSTSTVALHLVTADWGEAGSNSGNSGPGMGAGTGAPAQNGDATWTMRFFPSTAWAQAGGDFIATASATTTATVAGGTVTWTSAQLAADVQAWISGAQPNHGWCVRGDEITPFNGLSFRSREHPITADRPVLTITWAPAAAVTTLGSGCSGSTGAPLALSAVGLPTVPNPTFAMSLGGGPAGPQAFFAFAAASAVPLPLSATCFIYGDPLTLVATIVQQSPLNLPIPSAPALIGGMAVFQGLTVDQSALLLVTSNGLVLHLGL